MQLEKDYKNLLRNVLSTGDLRPNRTDTQAYSLFNQELNFTIHEDFPIFTSKYIDFRIMQTEFEWFKNGETNIQRFKDRGISIWDAWANEGGELGPVYGYQMLNFNSQGFNQLEEVIKSISTKPFGRRHIISLWNPAQLQDMALPPCYLYFQFYVTKFNSLNMFVVQRSADLFAGVPYDLGVFSLLLIHVAQQTKLTPTKVAVKFVDAHIYENHVDGVLAYLDRPMHPSPKWGTCFDSIIFTTPYIHEPKIKIKIAK